MNAKVEEGLLAIADAEALIRGEQQAAFAALDTEIRGMFTTKSGQLDAAYLQFTSDMEDNYNAFYSTYAGQLADITSQIQDGVDTVKSVNNTAPDANGNVAITIPQVDTSNLATKTDVQNMVGGSPKGVYATLSALQTAFPTGTTGVYLVTADGGWYYWNGTA